MSALFVEMGGRKLVATVIGMACITIMAVFKVLTLEVMGAITLLVTGYNTAAAIEDSAKAKAAGQKATADATVVVAAMQEPTTPAQVKGLTEAAGSQPLIPVKPVVPQP